MEKFETLKKYTLDHKGSEALFVMESENLFWFIPLNNTAQKEYNPQNGFLKFFAAETVVQIIMEHN